MFWSFVCRGSIAAIARSFSELAPGYAPDIHRRALYCTRSVSCRKGLVRPFGRFHISAPYVMMGLMMGLIMPVYSDLTAPEDIPLCELEILHMVFITVFTFSVLFLI